jgi:hypothetical protein
MLMKNALFSVTLIGSCLLGECASTRPPAPPSVQPVSSNQSPPARSGYQDLRSSKEADEQPTQTIFGAELEVKRPVTVPFDVLRILRNDERIQTRLGKRESPDDLSASWFAASEIELNDDSQPDLILQAVNPHLFGANLVPFWLFQKTPKGYKLIFSVDALGLEVLKTKTNNYRNIHSTKATAKEILNATYEFDGDKYEERSSSREPIKH